jgi:sigma-B regulation protein RsbU (phosphoserine phosphatase)
MKLTPARRIMLALALVLLVTGMQRIEIRTSRVDLRFPFFGSLLLFSVLVLELKDKLTARDELEAGRKVQLALSPSEDPDIPNWDVWLYTQPANDVGGDVIDHLPLGARSHSVALGDVAGKALPAALLSVKLQATLRALAPQFSSLADLGSAMNRILYRDGLPTRFASLVYLVLDGDSGKVRVLNAGHMPPLLVRGNSVTPSERGGMVLGIMPEASFTEQHLELEMDDVLVVYSDGVSEAQNEQGDFFGDDRLFDLAKAPSGGTSRAIGVRILEAVEGFIGHAPQSDDISLMVLRRRPAP